MDSRTLYVLFVDVLAVLLIHEVVFSKCDLKTKTHNHPIKSFVHGFQRKERQALPIDPSRMYLPPSVDAVVSSGFGAPNIESSNFGSSNNNNNNAVGYGEVPLVQDTIFSNGTDGDYGTSSITTTTKGLQSSGNGVQTTPVITQSYDSDNLSTSNGSSSWLGQRTSFVDTLASRGNNFPGNLLLNDDTSTPATEVDYSDSMSETIPNNNSDGSSDKYRQNKLSSTTKNEADLSGWQTTQRTEGGNRNSYGPTPENFDGFPRDGYGSTTSPLFGRNLATNNREFDGTLGNAYQQDAMFEFPRKPDFNDPRTTANRNNYGQHGPQAGVSFNSQGDTTGYGSQTDSAAQSYGQIDFIPSVSFTLHNNEFGALNSGPNHYNGQTSTNNEYNLQGQQQLSSNFGPHSFSGGNFVQAPSNGGYLPPPQISNFGQTTGSQTSSFNCGANGGWKNNQAIGASNSFRSNTGYETQNKKTDSTLVPKDQYKNSNFPNQDNFEKPVNNNRDYGEPAPNAFSNFAPGNVINQPPPSNFPDVQLKNSIFPNRSDFEKLADSIKDYGEPAPNAFSNFAPGNVINQPLPSNISDVQYNNSIFPSRSDFEKPADNIKDYGEPAPNAFSNFAPGNVINQPPPSNVPDVQFKNSILPSRGDFEKPANSNKDYGEPVPNAFSNFAPCNLPNQPLSINNICDNHNNNANKQTETVFSPFNTGY